MENKGAFFEACEYIINKDMDLKNKIIEEHLDDPINNHPWMANMSGQDMMAFIFGDYQAFVNEWNDENE
jgi:hypothetical protein